MSESDSQDNTFRLGLTMAGAISAGAYTAGVLDFLFAALKEQDPDTDGIRVVLKAMSGTSAGGVCTALSVPALIEGIRPPDPKKPSVPLLHAIWVEELDFRGDEKRAGLVSDSDLERERDDPDYGHVQSLLNSRAIEEAASRVLDGVAWTGQPYDFIARELELFITCTNLAGQPYRVQFSAGDDHAGHLMANHAYVGHFRVSGLGTQPVRSHWLDIWRDRGVSLRLDPAATPDHPQPIDFEAPGGWHDLREMGVVTGAFPVGLAAKRIDVTAREFGVFDPDEDNCSRGGAWALEIDPALRPVPTGQGELVCAQPLSFIGVDGGVCNNEPFELARYALRGASLRENARPWDLEPNPRKPAEADRAVIMIDPFPEGPEPDLARKLTAADRAIIPVVSALKSALLNQARFKPGELVAAMDGAGRSRFLIAPVRDGKYGSDAIASGLLGGFGGFFSEDFREHDFQLGRRNCQKFLSDYFNLQAPHQKFAALGGGGQPGPEPTEVPILHLKGRLTDEIALPEWPRLDVETALDLVRSVRARVGRVAGVMIRQSWSGWAGKILAGQAWEWAGRGRIERMLTRIIGAELIARDQLKELARKSENERKVLSALVAPGADLRTPSGLAAATKLERAEVEAALSALRADPGHELFTLWDGPEIAVGGREERTVSIRAYRPKGFLLAPVIGPAMQSMFGRLSNDGVGA